MAYHIQGTRKSSQCVVNFSGVDFPEDNSGGSDETNDIGANYET